MKCGKFEPTRYESECYKYFMEKDVNGNWYVCQREQFPVGNIFLCFGGVFENDSRNREVFPSMLAAQMALDKALNPTFYTRDNTLVDMVNNRTSFEDMQLCAATLGYPYFLWGSDIYNTKSEHFICYYSSPNVKIELDNSKGE